MNNTVIMDKDGMRRAIIRLSHEMMEHTPSSDGVVLVGIRRGGEVLAGRIAAYLSSQGITVPCAGIDIAAFRDDGKREETGKLPDLGFSIDGKTVVLCDDVLHTGRSVRAAIDGLFACGRPSGVKLLVLADRGGREVPVRADHVGKNVTAAKSERVEVEFEELGATEDRLYITKLV